MTTEITLAIVLMSAVTIYLIACSLPVASSYAVSRTGRSVGLVVHPEVEALVRRRVSRRALIAAIGGVAGAGLGALILAVGELAPSDGAYWILLGSYFGGVATASAISAITLRAPDPDDRPRIARTSAVTLSDYAPGVERIPARVLVVTTVALAAGALVVQARVPSANVALTASLAVVAVLGVAALLLFELAARRIVDRGRVATSPLELAWDDALRSLSVRDVLTAPLVLGAWGTVFGIGVLAGPALQAVDFLGAPLSVTAALCALVLVPVVLVVTSLARPAQHYLRRLWPDVAAQGQAR